MHMFCLIDKTNRVAMTAVGQSDRWIVMSLLGLNDIIVSAFQEKCRIPIQQHVRTLQRDMKY